MFRFPDTWRYAVDRREALARAEQRCTCGAWFDVTEPLRVMLRECAERERERGSVFVSHPFYPCTCAVCGAASFLIMPGKYDSRRSKRPTMQRLEFKEEP